MAKIAALVPKQYMAEYVEMVSKEENIPVDFVKVIETADSIIEARNAIENGATILIARGLQAAMIKEYTNIPITEIEMTGQEIYGTLLIRDIENLCPVCQYRLLRLLQYKVFMPNDIEETKILDIRIIVTSHKNLAYQVKQGSFREDLYYLLSSMTLQIPPLRQRREDVLYLLEQTLARFNQVYTKYISLSQGAKAVLCEYDWEGNVLQLERFCERLVLTAGKRVVDEVQVKELLAELYPTIRLEHGEEKLVVYQSPEAVKITEILEKCHGNRNQAANELGISTTTLWRKMKKYGISGSYLK